MFNRLFDIQCGRYMATGYNSDSLHELIDAYIEYKSVDNDDEDYSKLSTKEMIDIIQTDEFEIESSEAMFEEYED